MLIIQSSEVFDLMLNFTAVLFLSELDDLAFGLSNRGYFGLNIKKEATRVKQTFYFYSTETEQRAYKSYYHSALLAIVLVAMYIGFFITWIKQVRGMDYYTCDTNLGSIHVEFGDGVVPSLGLFSGFYELSKKQTIGSRVGYQHFDIPQAKFGYCDQNSVWTFFYDDEDKDDPCISVLARSSETISYDIMTIEPSTWFSMDDVPLDYIQILCSDVAPAPACHGTFSDDGEWCPSLLVPSDLLIGFSPKTSRQFEALDDEIEFNKHPVYQGVSTDGQLDLILYTGRRWVLTDTTKLNISDPSELSGFFDSSQFPKDAIPFVSDAVSAASDTCSPANLAWHYASTPRKRKKAAMRSSNFQRPIPHALFHWPLVAQSVTTRLIVAGMKALVGAMEHATARIAAQWDYSVKYLP